MALLETLRALRPDEDSGFVSSALLTDVPPMRFGDLVTWVQHFTTTAMDLLTPFLSAMTDEQLTRLHTLEHVGSWKSDDPPALHRLLVRDGRRREDMIAIVARVRHDDLAKGLSKLATLGVEPDDRWHESIPIDPTPPHNYAVEPRWLRVRTPGSATYRQVFDLIDETRVKGGAVLFASDDPSMGPYSKCVYVKESAVDYWCKHGYRRLDAWEEMAAEPEIEDYTETWNHSE